MLRSDQSVLNNFLYKILILIIYWIEIGKQCKEKVLNFLNYSFDFPLIYYNVYFNIEHLL